MQPKILLGARFLDKYYLFLQWRYDLEHHCNQYSLKGGRLDYWQFLIVAL